MVKLLAGLTPAKINLFLRVVGRRPDGYHLLDSIFLPISVFDRIRLEIRSASNSSVAILCDSPELPTDTRNLAVRAAHAFMVEFGLRAQALITLEKNIPVGAGLGGGSSDAGAVLKMMAQLTRIEDASRLRKIALAIGADVPFFLNPRASRVGGIGEEIVPLDSISALPILILVPPIEVSTAKIFGQLKPEDWSGPSPRAFEDSSDTDLQSLMVNDLASTAIRLHPEIGALLDTLKNLGARASAMSGSGGAVFGVFTDDESLAQAARQAGKLALNARIIAARILCDS
jgi:4-diphosphocytidyl-2-C-methyl-D-erythritol kinase